MLDCAVLVYLKTGYEALYVVISSPLFASTSQSLCLLDLVQEGIRVKHYGLRAAIVLFIRWIKDYVYIHDKCHLHEMGKVEVEVFRRP